MMMESRVIEDPLLSDQILFNEFEQAKKEKTGQGYTFWARVNPSIDRSARPNVKNVAAEAKETEAKGKFGDDNVDVVVLSNGTCLIFVKSQAITQSLNG